MPAGPREQLHATFLARGYRVEFQLDSPEAFGSWFVDYLRSDRRFRLIWDGKDDQFILEGGQQWHVIAIKRPAELRSGGIASFLLEVE